MSAADRGHVDRLLGGPSLARLVDRLVKRLEQGREPTGTVTLPDATDAERSAIAALVGRPIGAGATVSVRLDAVDAVLRTSGAAEGLRAAVEALRGPVAVRADVAGADRAAWDEAFGALDPAVRGRPTLERWRDALRASGTVRRTAGDAAQATVLLRRVATVLEALPADREGLPVFAARVLGDAHALDPDRPESAIVLGAARALLPDAPPPGEGPAEARRRLWAGLGVLLDSLSSTVLVHAMPAGSATGRALAALAEAGEPAVLTLRQLAQPGLLAIEPGAELHVCENPAVVEAAATRLGPRCLPLVCTGGQPSAAAQRLLAAARADGARLVYHGDFDWGGLRIANGVLQRTGAEPWRFRAEDYRAAVRPDAAPLLGAPVDAAWDPALRPLMERAGVKVEEEQVLDALLADLVPRA